MTHFTPGWPPLALLLNDSPPTSKAEKVEGERRTPEQEQADREKDRLDTGAMTKLARLDSLLDKFNGAATVPGSGATCTERASPEAAPPSKPATQAGEWIEHDGKSNPPISLNAVLTGLKYRDGLVWYGIVRAGLHVVEIQPDRTVRHVGVLWVDPEIFICPTL